MGKLLFILLAGCVLLSACGKDGPQGVFSFLPEVKSEIKDSVTPESIAETPKTFILPITGIDPYKSGIHDIGFIFGGIANAFGDIATRIFRMGDLNYTLTQKIPELPTNYLEYFKIKRIFFYIEPKDGNKRYYNWFEERVFGKEDATFSFLDKLAIKMKSEHVDPNTPWDPVPVAIPFARNEKSGFFDVFKKKDDNIFNNNVEIKGEDEVLLVAYDKDQKHKYVQGDNVGPIYVVKVKSQEKEVFTPGQQLTKLAAARTYFTSHKKLKGFFKRTVILENMLVLEFVNDPVILDSFRMILNEPVSREEIEQLDVDPVLCQSDYCMDFKLPEANFVKMIGQDNALKLDAVILVTSPPASFAIKGFIEFEFKLKPEREWR